MIGSFRQSMTWLHTWAGLIFCWLLYLMFVTGTLGYFDDEIDRWMQPERELRPDISLAENLRVAETYLQETAADADRWYIGLPNERTEPYLRVFWQGQVPEDENEERKTGNEELDVTTGQPFGEHVRETGGGQVLYRMHYRLHYLPDQAAFRFMGIVTLLMFVGIISGIIVHKKIFKDFFTFRPQKAKRSWLDMHNLLSVSTLPFQIMITYSGLLFVTFLWMPLVAFGGFGFDQEKTANMLGNLTGEVQVERSEEIRPLAPLAPMAAIAAQEWGESEVHGFNIQFPNDANARVTVSRKAGISALSESMVFDGASGDLLESKPPHVNNTLAVGGTFIGLHEGLFAGPLLRWLYFLWGLMGTAMIATGAIYWVAKRKPKTADIPLGLGYRFVEKLNIGTIVGLLVGVAVYFLANRLLPLGMAERDHWEVHCMFIAWGLCLIHPLFRPARQAWIEQWWIAAGAFLAIPIVNALTTDAHLGNSLPAADWVLAGFDLTAIATAVVCAATAVFMSRRGQRVAAAKQAPEAVTGTIPSTS
ncbi:MAG: PepSY-associated TM helix domain-containing protein [Pseudomonadota bacterium]